MSRLTPTQLNKHVFVFATVHKSELTFTDKMLFLLIKNAKDNEKDGFLEIRKC